MTILSVTGRHARRRWRRPRRERDEVGTAPGWRRRREPVPTAARACDGRAGLAAFGGGRWPPDRLSRAFFAAAVRTDGSVRKVFCNIPDSLYVWTYSSRRRTV